MAVGNLLGAVVIFDGENPRSFTGTAKETISGGQFVYLSGAVNLIPVGSQASSLQDGDLVLKVCDTIGYCNGIALNNAATDELVTVARRGDYLIKSAGVISGGQLVTNNGRGDAVSPPGMVATSASVGSWIGIVGRAMTNAGSEDYCLVSLNL